MARDGHSPVSYTGKWLSGIDRNCSKGLSNAGETSHDSFLIASESLRRTLEASDREAIISPAEPLVHPKHRLPVDISWREPLVTTPSSSVDYLTAIGRIPPEFDGVSNESNGTVRHRKIRAARMQTRKPFRAAGSCIPHVRRIGCIQGHTDIGGVVIETALPVSLGVSYANPRSASAMDAVSFANQKRIARSVDAITDRD